MHVVINSKAQESFRVITTADMDQYVGFNIGHGTYLRMMQVCLIQHMIQM